jgi:hypothetical protein
MLRGKLFYKDRAFMVYLTIDGLSDKVNKYCKRYGISHSKLAQQAIVEKLEREEKELGQQELKNLQGSRIEAPASQAADLTTTTTATTDTTTPTNTQAGLMSTTSSSSRGQRSGGGVVDVHVR